MKRTLALIGLLFVGLLLLFDPESGIVAAGTEQNFAASSVPTSPTTTSGPPLLGTSTTVAPQEAPTATSLSPAFAVVGDSVDTRFGPFQVEILIEDGVMVDVVTVAEPGDRRSQRINDIAIPLYEEAAISSQSADIDAVSGATVTWRAYTASLGSALQAAGL